MVFPGINKKILTNFFLTLCQDNTPWNLKKGIISTLNGLPYFAKRKVSSRAPNVPAKKTKRKGDEILPFPVSKNELGSSPSLLAVKQKCQNLLFEKETSPVLKLKIKNGKSSVKNAFGILNKMKLNDSWASSVSPKTGCELYACVPYRHIPKSPRGHFFAMDKVKNVKKFFSCFKTRHPCSGVLCNTQVRNFFTSSVNNGCLPSPPPPEPSKCVIPKTEKEICLETKQPTWPPVETILMPCCCCPTKSVECAANIIPQINLCKKVEYRIPSFSECKRSSFPNIHKKECCYYIAFCPHVGKKSGLQKLVRTKTIQEQVLGRLKDSKHASRSYSTDSRTTTNKKTEKLDSSVNSQCGRNSH